MSSLRCLLLSLMVMAVSGCVSPGPTAVESRILGSWEWVEASGGIAGMRITPESTGIEREIRFLDGRRAQLWENGELLRTVTYEIGKGDPDGSLAGHEVVRWSESLLGGWEEQALEFPQLV